MAHEALFLRDSCCIAGLPLHVQPDNYIHSEVRIIHQHTSVSTALQLMHTTIYFNLRGLIDAHNAHLKLLARHEASAEGSSVYLSPSQILYHSTVSSRIL